MIICFSIICLLKNRETVSKAEVNNYVRPRGDAPSLPRTSKLPPLDSQAINTRSYLNVRRFQQNNPPIAAVRGPPKLNRGETLADLELKGKQSA